MTLPQHDISRLQSEMSAAVKAHWKAFLFEGILLAILGLAAIIVPPIASLAITIFLGWMFLIAGIGGGGGSGGGAGAIVGIGGSGGSGGSRFYL